MQQFGAEFLQNAKNGKSNVFQQAVAASHAQRISQRNQTEAMQTGNDTPIIPPRGVDQISFQRKHVPKPIKSEDIPSILGKFAMMHVSEGESSKVNSSTLYHDFHDSSTGNSRAVTMQTPPIPRPSRLRASTTKIPSMSIPSLNLSFMSPSTPLTSVRTIVTPAQASSMVTPRTVQRTILSSSANQLVGKRVYFATPREHNDYTSMSPSYYSRERLKAPESPCFTLSGTQVIMESSPRARLPPIVLTKRKQ